MIRAIVRFLGLHRRYGVRFAGGKERSGFRRRYAADAFAQDNAPAVVFDYEPAADLRIDGSKGDHRAVDRAPARVRWVP